jgi:hypothetical protein
MANWGERCGQTYYNSVLGRVSKTTQSEVPGQASSVKLRLCGDDSLAKFDGHESRQEIARIFTIGNTGVSKKTGAMLAETVILDRGEIRGTGFGYLAFMLLSEYTHSSL